MRIAFWHKKRQPTPKPLDALERLNAQLLAALEALLPYAEYAELRIEGEWGASRSLQQLDARGELPEEIVQAHAAIAAAKGA